MKRSGFDRSKPRKPLQRKTTLQAKRRRPKSDRVRDVLDRVKRTTGDAMVRTGPPSRQPTSPAAIVAMLRAFGNKCIVCGGAWQHPHHVLPKRQFPQWRDEHRNIVPICAGCHDNHERAHRRIRWDELPIDVRLWVMAQAATEPHAGAVSAYIGRTYPLAPSGPEPGGRPGERDEE